MSSQRELSYYGKACYTFFQDALRPQGLKLYFDTEKQANNYRRTLYNYRYALRDEGFANNQDARIKHKLTMKVEICLYGDTLFLHKRPPTIVQEAEHNATTPR